jgi:hypothetical protein
MVIVICSQDESLYPSFYKKSIAATARILAMINSGGFDVDGLSVGGVEVYQR